MGDGQELGAIDDWYGKAAGRCKESPLLIGSVKSNMGHCEGASGLAGTHQVLAVCNLMLDSYACGFEDLIKQILIGQVVM